jgi:hypothetical protein
MAEKGKYTRGTLVELMNLLGYTTADRVSRITAEADAITVTCVELTENGPHFITDRYVLSLRGTE